MIKWKTLLWVTVLTTLIGGTSTAPPAAEDHSGLVEKAAAGITDDLIREDQLFLQEVVKDYSIYRHAKNERHGAPTFIRKGSDAGKVRKNKMNC